MAERHVLVELRGRIDSEWVLKTVSDACDGDFGARSGSTFHVLVSAAAAGQPARIKGVCKDGRPVRLNDILRQTGLEAVVKSASDAGRPYDEIYFISQKHGVSPDLPFTKFGPAVPQYVIDQMKTRNPFFGLDEIKRSLACYDPENYPKFGTARPVLGSYVELTGAFNCVKAALKAAF